MSESYCFNVNVRHDYWGVDIVGTKEKVNAVMEALNEAAAKPVRDVRLTAIGPTGDPYGPHIHAPNQTTIAHETMRLLLAGLVLHDIYQHNHPTVMDQWDAALNHALATADALMGKAKEQPCD